MSSDSPRARRRASWLTVVGWLVGSIALSGLACPAGAQTPPAGQPVGLQKLVDELSDQFWFAYRANVPEHRLRHDSLRLAIAAWNKSTKTSADRQLMTAWLRDAMQTSMPGSRQPLPPLPDFSKSAAAAAAETAAAPAASSAPQSTTSNKPVVPELAPDMPGGPAESQSQEQQDFWFAQPTAASPTDKGQESSDKFWEGYPTENKPSDSPPSGNPFGDDPLGL